MSDEKKIDLLPDQTKFPAVTKIAPAKLVESQERIRKARIAANDPKAKHHERKAAELELQAAEKAHQELCQAQVDELRKIALQAQQKRMMSR